MSKYTHYLEQLAIDSSVKITDLLKTKYEPKEEEFIIDADKVIGRERTKL